MSDKVCKKCGGTRFSKTGCYYCAKERGRIYRLKKGKKPRSAKIKYCKNCDKDTPRTCRDACKVCADRYLLKYSDTSAEVKERDNCRLNNVAFILLNKSITK